MNERFGKPYKLCSKKLIEEVFKKGQHLKKYPLQLRFLKTDQDLPVPFQIGISVPKRNFRQAVKRNRIKRLIREAVRKNKHIVEEEFTQTNSGAVLFIIFIDRKMPTYKTVEKSVRSLFNKLIEDSNNE